MNWVISKDSLAKIKTLLDHSLTGKVPVAYLMVWNDIVEHSNYNEATKGKHGKKAFFELQRKGPKMKEVEKTEAQVQSTINCEITIIQRCS